MDQTASRSRPRLAAQRAVTRALLRFAPGFAEQSFNWGIYRDLDAMIYCVPHEWEVAQYLFEAPPDRGSVIPHGLEEDALAALREPQAEEDYLVSVATIHPRKNSVLLAEAALLAKTPVVFLGRPYADDDPYFLRFQSLIDGRFVRYPGFVSVEEKYRWLRGARGFVLLSQYESGCIAAFEAAAAGLPMLLSDLPWATRGYPGARDLGFVEPRDPARIAPALAGFFQKAHRQPTPTFPVLSWREVALRYRAIYEAVLAR